MIVFKCGQCGEEMEAPQSEAGKVGTCPECKAINRVPRLAQSAWQPTEPLAELTQAVDRGRLPLNPESQPAHSRKDRTSKNRKVWLIVVPVVLLMLGLTGYFVALQVGPESWRINGDGRTAYAALQELDTSIQTPIGRDEYGGCVRRALLKVKPYLESGNAKSCPAFSEWIGKSITYYAMAAEKWNEPLSYPGYEATARLAQLKYEWLQSDVRLHVQIHWSKASLCLLNAKCIIDGKPGEVKPLPKDENPKDEN